MQRPFIHPYAYNIIILMFTIVTTAIFILLLLLLFCHYYYYKTVATDKLLQASLFPGATELTTHLLRLINILWLPLCRINKFGFHFSRRLLQSPILVGHQRLLFGYGGRSSSLWWSGVLSLALVVLGSWVALALWGKSWLKGHGCRLEGGWYVSNISIIFDAPCLFLHHLPIVSLHLVAFLYIFRN
jgi:hypothetical protein